MREVVKGDFMKQKDVAIPVEPGVELFGQLSFPDRPKGLILFVHGSGSSRFSTRNQFVATQMQKLGFATLLFDLLTLDEDKIDKVTRKIRFDIQLLTRRLEKVTEWVLQDAQLKHLKIGYFGASTGAAAALIAASRPTLPVTAIVSRGGRPDLASSAFSSVKAPTLLLVGGHDYEVIALNESAQAQMLSCKNKLELIPDATHLFEEPGALEQVAESAGKWFYKYMAEPRKDGYTADRHVAGHD